MSKMNEDRVHNVSQLPTFIPNELWTAIFESLSPKDLRRVLVTCKFFYPLALRVLCRDIVWGDPRQFLKMNASSSLLWPSMPAMPRTLAVSISPLPADISRMLGNIMSVEVTGEITTVRQGLGPQGGNVNSEPQTMYCASPDLYNLVRHRISSFINLNSLEFFRSFLSENVYTTIASLPVLKKLAIMDCILPAYTDIANPYSVYNTIDFTALPITELTLRAIRGDCELTEADTVIGLRRLMTASNLRRLSIDWTRTNSYFLANIPIPPIAHFEMQEPTKDQWRLEAGLPYLMPRFADFLLSHTSLASLVLPDASFHFPAFPMATYRDPGFLPNLQRYSGPIETLKQLTSPSTRTSLKAVRITTTLTPQILSETLPSLPLSFMQEVTSLCLDVSIWDTNEIMYPLSTSFPSLVNFTLRYHSGSPTEQTVLSLGGVFLARMKKLERVRVYNPKAAFGVDFLDGLGGAEVEEKERKDKGEERARKRQLDGRWGPDTSSGGEGGDDDNADGGGGPTGGSGGAGILVQTNNPPHAHAPAHFAMQMGAQVPGAVLLQQHHNSTHNAGSAHVPHFFNFHQYVPQVVQLPPAQTHHLHQNHSQNVNGFIFVNESDAAEENAGLGNPWVADEDDDLSEDDEYEYVQDVLLGAHQHEHHHDFYERIPQESINDAGVDPTLMADYRRQLAAIHADRDDLDDADEGSSAGASSSTMIASTSMSGTGMNSGPSSSLAGSVGASQILHTNTASTNPRVMARLREVVETLRSRRYGGVSSAAQAHDVELLVEQLANDPDALVEVLDSPPNEDVTEASTDEGNLPTGIQGIDTTGNAAANTSSAAAVGDNSSSSSSRIDHDLILASSLVTPDNTDISMSVPTTLCHPPTQASSTSRHGPKISIQTMPGFGRQERQPQRRPLYVPRLPPRPYKRRSSNADSISRSNRERARGEALRKNAKRKADEAKMRADKMARSGDANEEARQLILPWRRFCRSLREVKLFGGNVAWRRRFDGDAWVIGDEDDEDAGDFDDAEEERRKWRYYGKKDGGDGGSGQAN